MADAGMPVQEESSSDARAGDERPPAGDQSPTDADRAPTQPTSPTTAQAADVPDQLEASPIEVDECEPWSLGSSPLTPQRVDLILLESVAFENRWWIQLHASGGLLDTRRDMFIARWNAGLLFGRRFSRFGVFGITEFDQAFELTLDTRRLDLMKLGAGVEMLNFLGRMRSSLAIGGTALLSSTSIDQPGQIGWFIDFSPVAIRWPLGSNLVFELTPISLDVTVPVTSGIPLVIVSNMTVFSIEWSIP